MLMPREIARKLRVVVPVIEQRVARPGVALHRVVGDEDVVRAAVDVVGVLAHGEGADHGRAGRGAADDVELEAALDQRFVESDVRGAQRAAAAGDEAERGAVDEADRGA